MLTMIRDRDKKIFFKKKKKKKKKLAGRNGSFTPVSTSNSPRLTMASSSPGLQRNQGNVQKQIWVRNETGLLGEVLRFKGWLTGAIPIEGV